jgi:transposase
MSTSILYHAFGLKGIRHTSTHFKSDALIFRAEMTDDFIRCPKCGFRQASFKGQKTRWFFMSLIGRKKCMLVLDYHRLKCLDCGTLWWPSLPFMVGKHRYVRSFALTVLDMLRFGTIRSVAHYLGVGWDMVKDIHKSKLRILYRKIPLHKVRYIGIDEFSIRKGHQYMTVVTDLRSGRILHAVEGKSKEDITPFLQKLARKGRKLEGVAMDMSSAYYHAVREILPHLDIVFDRYHIMALINDAIEDLRREQQKELDKLGQQTLKGNRFLLLRNYEDLAPDRKARLDALLQVNQPLFTIHSMKEQLRLFWEKENGTAARAFLETWCRDALNSGVKHLAKVAKTLAAYRSGLLNYFKHPITSAMVEGINNKIKTLKRQAYGFRDQEYFKLRLYHLHTQRYSLTG